MLPGVRAPKEIVDVKISSVGISMLRHVTLQPWDESYNYIYSQDFRPLGNQASHIYNFNIGWERLGCFALPGVRRRFPTSNPLIHDPVRVKAPDFRPIARHYPLPTCRECYPAIVVPGAWLAYSKTTRRSTSLQLRSPAVQPTRLQCYPAFVPAIG